MYVLGIINNTNRTHQFMCTCVRVRINTSIIAYGRRKTAYKQLTAAARRGLQTHTHIAPDAVRLTCKEIGMKWGNH